MDYTVTKKVVGVFVRFSCAASRLKRQFQERHVSSIPSVTDTHNFTFGVGLTPYFFNVVSIFLSFERSRAQVDFTPFCSGTRFLFT
jgi:hypothetical protein